MKTCLFFVFLLCCKLGAAQNIIAFNDDDKTRLEIANTLNKADAMFAQSTEEMSPEELNALKAKMSELTSTGILLMAGGGALMLWGIILNNKGVPDEFKGIDGALIFCGAIPFLVGAACTIFDRIRK